MQPTQHIPEGYHPIKTIDIKKDTRLLMRLSLISLALVVPVIVMLMVFGIWLNPQVERIAELYNVGLSAVEWLVAVIVINAIFVVFHEGIHGIFFWGFTKQIPRFGLGAAYAFAAAPDWFIPGNRYRLIGSSPLVIITIAGVLIMPYLPAKYLLMWIFGLVINITGSVGDLYILAQLSPNSETLLVRDAGDIIELYQQEQI